MVVINNVLFVKMKIKNKINFNLVTSLLFPDLLFKNFYITVAKYIILHYKYIMDRVQLLLIFKYIIPLEKSILVSPNTISAKLYWARRPILYSSAP